MSTPMTATREDVLAAIESVVAPAGKTALAMTVIQRSGRTVDQRTYEPIDKAIRRELRMAQFERTLIDLVEEPDSPVVVVADARPPKTRYATRERYQQIQQESLDRQRVRAAEARREEAISTVLERHADEVEAEIKLLEVLDRIHES